MALTDQSLTLFAESLAAKTSVPGGGGAAAAAGALAAALGSMVGVYTLGKKKYAEVEPDIRRLMVEAKQLREKLLLCVDEDAQAFAPLSVAYGMPKTDPSRPEVLEKCLHDAAAVPARVARLCARVIEMQAELSKKGSSLMISDAGVGAALARAALQSAVLNVRVNTALMQDRAHADFLNDCMQELLDSYAPKAEEIVEYVMGRLG